MLLLASHSEDTRSILEVNIRDILNKTDKTMRLNQYLRKLHKRASQFTPDNYAGEQERLYGKDLDCPPEWRSSLATVLPKSIEYWSKRADLMSSLPDNARAENMMCYIGGEGTFTPCHTAMCATLGQNIMIFASEDGSSVWFMTKTADRKIVEDYWSGTLHHNLWIEEHFASIESLMKAPFTVYILHQKVGDLVLIPSSAPHQVWNRGTYTCKVAWDRTTVKTLKLAVEEALPSIRRVCRDEQYKVKAIVYDTLVEYTRVLLSRNETELKFYPPNIEGDYTELYDLLTKILLDEHFSPSLPKGASLEEIRNEYNVTCSFCRCDIFNRFLTCEGCSTKKTEENYDVCMDCYARGRSCLCVSGLSWVEQHSWDALIGQHEEFRLMAASILEENSPNAADAPRYTETLNDARTAKRSLATVCQEALRTRPCRRLASKEGENEGGDRAYCHICIGEHARWKTIRCTQEDEGCYKAYCFSCLWHAFGMDTHDNCLAKLSWVCPCCEGFCLHPICDNKPKQNPSHLKRTILGVVTRHVADQRSVESLVDLGNSNAEWLTIGIGNRGRIPNTYKQELPVMQLPPNARRNNFKPDSRPSKPSSKVDSSKTDGAFTISTPASTAKRSRPSGGYNIDKAVSSLTPRTPDGPPTTKRARRDIPLISRLGMPRGQLSGSSPRTTRSATPTPTSSSISPVDGSKDSISKKAGQPPRKPPTTAHVGNSIMAAENTMLSHQLIQRPSVHLQVAVYSAC
ncbi:hypothetical protein Dda_7046 [Drechslerella dactyloides]|uniref:JmjC domain-containing protein n=1 Tax=Drechslerella dactyloides TaxID=74499 RepID=A0AAD6NH42_DREDA|nr:hypothetical protein Dda_7046 [Drechslerella dactyloides]